MASNKEALKKTLSDIKDFGVGFVEFGKGFLDSLLVIPTAYRKSNEVGFVGSAYAAGVSLGFNPIAFASNFMGYVALFNYDKNIAFPILATQLTTNSISSLYERIKYNKLKIEEKNNEAEKSSELEEITKEEIIEKIPVTPNIINPWEINVPKLGGNKNE